MISLSGHQLTLTRHFGLTKLTPSLQIDLTKIHCVHLRYSILARHQITAEPACRFLQPRRRLARDGSLFVAPVLRRRNQPPPPSMPCTSNRRVSAPAFRSFAISRYWADSKNPRKAVAFEKDRSTILSLSQRPLDDFGPLIGCQQPSSELLEYAPETRSVAFVCRTIGEFELSNDVGGHEGFSHLRLWMSSGRCRWALIYLTPSARSRRSTTSPP